MKNRISLEPEAVEVANANCTPPLIFQMPPWKGREVLEEAQNAPVCMYPADFRKLDVNTGEWGEIPVYILCPEHITSPANVIFYIHGAGWVFGSFNTHEKLVRELAARTDSVVVFPEYSRSPEARYPVAIEQCYNVLCRLSTILRKMDIQMNPCTLTVAGDSVGGKYGHCYDNYGERTKGTVYSKTALILSRYKCLFLYRFLLPVCGRVLPLPGRDEVVLGSVYDVAM